MYDTLSGIEAQCMIHCQAQCMIHTLRLSEQNTDYEAKPITDQEVGPWPHIFISLKIIKEYTTNIMNIFVILLLHVYFLK